VVQLNRPKFRIYLNNASKFCIYLAKGQPIIQGNRLMLLYTRDEVVVYFGSDTELLHII